jgi:hypothetical protein
MQTANTNTQVAINGFTGTPILSRTGKVTGVEVIMGTLKASDIREAGKKLGLKGDKLTEYVNKALTDGKANAAARTAVTVSALESAGYVGNYATARKASATLHFVKPPEPKSAKAKAVAAIGAMTEAERAEILEILLGEAK